MIDKKFILEHTDILEKKIYEELKEGIKELEQIFSFKSISPKIYTVLLDENDFNFEYFLEKMASIDETNVYIDKEYYEIKELEMQEFIGYIVKNDEKYAFKYILEKDNRYEESIKKIYEAHLISKLDFLIIDKRYINRMYKIKIIEYIDYFDTNDETYTYDFNLDENFHFNKNIYWNIKKCKYLSKYTLSRLDDIAFVYTIDKKEDEIILLNMDHKLIEDVLSYDDKIVIYSKFSNLFNFDLYKVMPFDSRLIKNYTKINEKTNKIVSLGQIIKEFEKNNIYISDISTEKQEKKLIIPNYSYNFFNINMYKKNIYAKLNKYTSYDDVFNVVNYINDMLAIYELSLYE